MLDRPLRTEVESFHLLADRAKVMIWTSAPDKLCDWFNRAWLDFTGRTMEQELGDGWTEGVYPADLSRCLSVYTAAFDSRQEFSMEYRLRRHDGAYRWVFDVGSPYFSAEAEFLGYFGSCIDVTTATGDRPRPPRRELARLTRHRSMGEKAFASVEEKDARKEPSGTEIRAALERMAASESFQTCPRLAAFLRFVIEATLRGESAHLKGYTIAVEAFGRRGDFDPQQDPIVRVEAARLRRVIQHYYAGSGAAEFLVIDVPRGRYVPTFRYRRAEQANSELPLAGGALFAAGTMGVVPTAGQPMKHGTVDLMEKPVDETLHVASAHPQGGRFLTPREREVLAQIAAGASSKEAGRQLGISFRTVENHRARIMEKLGAKNAADLVRIASTRAV
jgi:PAS domain S-box-containing protein